MSDVYTSINLRATPQTEQADPRQVPNSAGGYTFTLDDEARIRRFLVLGSDGPTYYTSARDLTKDNAQVVIRMAQNDARKLVDILTGVSLAGRAPKQNPTLFALAAAASLGDLDGRRYALAALPQIARTGTHLFIFARYVEQFRGWGRALRRAVADWYLDKPVDSLAYQAVKYRQREGWSHRDLLRLSHPETTEPQRKALFDWISGRKAEGLPELVQWFEMANSSSAISYGSWLKGIQHGLTWEMLPDAALNEVEVWESLVRHGMPMTALVRQLPRLTRLGVARSERAAIVEQITDPERLQKARIHPVNVLVALRTYASGQSARGDSTWTPDAKIIDALDAAFYASFGFVEPANKRTLLALDVSGSMVSPISNMPLSCREASAALALVTAATEPDCDIVGFTGGTWGYRYGTNQNFDGSELSELPISPRQRLDDAVQAVSNLPFGGTDCSLPMLWALKNKRAYDTFAIYTDNETWAGVMHPHQALERYRRETGIPARLVVVGMTATNFSIADPNDPGSLDVAGFDSAVPPLITDFSRGL
jgi:60 kDa SS-A/Ro ribonucleoprotein